MPTYGNLPGQKYIAGIPGTQIEPTVAQGDQQIFYVNAGHANASDFNYGTDPDAPLATLQEVMDRPMGQSAIVSPVLAAGDVIYVKGNITETVVTNEDVPQDVHLIGVGGGIDTPVWTAATAAGTAFTLRQAGWTISGFRFTTGAAGTAVRLEWVPGSSYEANRTLITGNYFDGAWAGLYAIDLFGAPFDVWIVGNEFREYRRGDASAYAIIVTDSSTANPYMCVIRDNIFWENENHIGSLGNNKSFNLTLFKDNIFHDGVLIAATLLLDLRGGSQGENIVTGNTFCGDYSNAGGYYANAANPGMWVGNFAEDVLEAEVADNGVTVAPPA